MEHVIQCNHSAAEVHYKHTSKQMMCTEGCHSGNKNKFIRVLQSANDQEHTQFLCSKLLVERLVHAFL
jgi:hypothetical protein